MASATPSQPQSHGSQPGHPGPPSALITILGIAAGALAANLYYAQPLLAQIAPAIGISPALAGSIVSLTQIGYGLGLFLIVPLSDLLENRRVALTTLGCTAVGLAVAGGATSATIFLLASFLVGVSSSCAQVLLPYIAHLVPVERRGRVIGNVMAGLLTGIMLARPAALFLAASFGWRCVFWIASGLMVAIALLLAKIMPRRTPASGLHYGQILGSMLGLFLSMPAVRRRAIYQTLTFGAFSLFWTAAPLMLADRFQMGQRGIALFALAGAGGALAAPLAGRLADRGLIRITTFGSILTLGLCFYGTVWATFRGSLVALVILTILIDAAVQTNQVVSQRIIFAAPQEIRGRVNALYMTTAFVGGALGSILGTLTYHRGGWTSSASVGVVAGSVLLLLFATEFIRPTR